MLPILRDIPDQLETERLILRCPRPGDGRQVFEAVCDSIDALRAWPASLPWAVFEPSEEASERFCREGHIDYLARRNFQFLVFLKSENRYIGGNGLHSVDWALPRCEIGYWLRTGYHGRGLATEASQATTHFALQTLGMRRVVSLIDAENRASRAVAERAGYQLEGTLRNERKAPDGRLRHTALYACVA